MENEWLVLTETSDSLKYFIQFMASTKLDTLSWNSNSLQFKKAIQPPLNSYDDAPNCGYYEDRISTGYGGFNTFERCTRSARLANNIAAGTVAAACFTPESAQPVACALAVAGLAASSHHDVGLSCKNSYKRAVSRFGDCMTIGKQLCISNYLGHGYYERAIPIQWLALEATLKEHYLA